MTVQRRFAASLLLSAVAACQYDLDKPFSYSEVDASVVEQVPADLIDYWADWGLSDACKQCAHEKCAAVNEACRNEADCAELSRCVGKAQDPAGLNDCRAPKFDWLAADVFARDTGGPYQQCVFLSNCSAQCDARTQLSCARNYTWPTTTQSSVKAKLRFVQALGGVVAGISVKVCGGQDPLNCQSSGDPVVSDEKGEVEVELPVSLQSFQGYLELEGAGIYNSLLRFGWIVARDMVTSITVINRVNAMALVAASGAQFVPDRGQAQLRMFGCNSIPQRGVSFSVDTADQNTKTWYTPGRDPFPDFSLKETSDLGSSGIINIPKGFARAMAHRDGELIASVRVPVRPNYMTIVIVHPGDTTLAD